MWLVGEYLRHQMKVHCTITIYRQIRDIYARDFFNLPFGYNLLDPICF